MKLQTNWLSNSSSTYIAEYSSNLLEILGMTNVFKTP